LFFGSSQSKGNFEANSSFSSRSQGGQLDLEVASGKPSETGLVKVNGDSTWGRRQVLTGVNRARAVELRVWSNFVADGRVHGAQFVTLVGARPYLVQTRDSNPDSKFFFLYGQ